MIGYVIIFVKEMKDMAKRVNKKWWDSHVVVIGMESEEKNQEIKNSLEDEFNKKIEEE
tara:strand:+ start:133 stop:306 length:174 start_codon:yes stop_codon:yes gene_type:complete